MIEILWLYNNKLTPWKICSIHLKVKGIIASLGNLGRPTYQVGGGAFLYSSNPWLKSVLKLIKQLNRNLYIAYYFNHSFVLWGAIFCGTSFLNLLPCRYRYEYLYYTISLCESTSTRERATERQIKALSLDSLRHNYHFDITSYKQLSFHLNNTSCLLTLI